MESHSQIDANTGVFSAHPMEQPFTNSANTGVFSAQPIAQPIAPVYG